MHWRWIILYFIFNLLSLSTKGIEIEKIYVTTLEATTEYVSFDGIHNTNLNNTSKKYKTRAYISKTPETPLDPIANGLIYIRGKTSRLAPEKSYRVKFFEEGWNGENSLNLNRHYYDYSGIRNKLSFDLMERIPDITPPKTRFMLLYIRDLSKGEKEFEEYGLYTHVEAVNKGFLKRRSLDTKGCLYKAEFLEFNNLDVIKRIYTKEDYDKEELSIYAESIIRRSDKELAELIININNPLVTADDLFDRYIHEDNYFTWLAINILFDNVDTSSQNFLIYKGSKKKNKWNFIPWDYDGAWDYYNQVGTQPTVRARWRRGISNYWGSPLHQKILSNRRYREKLNSKIESIYQIITPKVVEEQLLEYEDLILKYRIDLPRSGSSRYSKESYLKEVKRISGLISTNKKLYYKTLNRPMPFFLGVVEKSKDGFIFYWGKSYSLENLGIRYRFQIARDPEFKDIIFQASDIKTEYIYVNKTHLKKEMVYWRVEAIDSKDNTQEAFDFIVERRIKYNGITSLDLR